MCTSNEMCECGKRHHDSAEFWRKAYYERCEEGTKREIEWTNRATKAQQELEQVSAHWKHLFDNVVWHNKELVKELRETRENCANEGAIEWTNRATKAEQEAEYWRAKHAQACETIELLRLDGAQTPDDTLAMYKSWVDDLGQANNRLSNRNYELEVTVRVLSQLVADLLGKR